MRTLRYVLPSLLVGVLAALGSFAILGFHLVQARQLPVAAKTLSQGVGQDLREAAVAVAVAIAIALLATATVHAKPRATRIALALATLFVFSLSAWPIQAVATTAAWAHQSAFRFIPLLTAWLAFPAAILLNRASQPGSAR
jgi:hypothetical protein